MATQQTEKVQLREVITTTNEETGKVTIEERMISIVRNVPSYDLRDRLRAIAEKYDIEGLDSSLALKAPKDGEDQMVFARRDPAAAKSYIDAKHARGRRRDMQTIEMVQAIINPFRLAADRDRELVATPVSDDTGNVSEFWRAQDLEGFEVWVDDFRTRNGIG